MSALTELTTLIFGLALIVGAPLAYLVLQPLLVIRLRGGWRVAALLPLLGALPALLWSLYAESRDSNLWPLPFIFCAAAGTIYLTILWAAHARRA